MQFLEWEKQRAQDWGLTFAGLTNTYFQSAAYVLFYSGYLAEHDPPKVKVITPMANFLVASTLYLTNRQTAIREVGGEYMKIKGLTENGKELTELEENYDVLYAANVMTIQAVRLFTAETGQTVLSELVSWIPVIVITLIFALLSDYDRRRQEQKPG